LLKNDVGRADEAAHYTVGLDAVKDFREGDFAA
jgi:hypothetical protein